MGRSWLAILMLPIAGAPARAGGAAASTSAPAAVADSSGSLKRGDSGREGEKGLEIPTESSDGPPWLAPN
jgi:hypothetical protein